ncbi:hypothetical protein D915_001210 [Fasciola hepatica]|uniref:Uncharacterized protein n=1 Tax=Fasciola hepatica TaxID=6192 RepID=A0A4E0RIK3_FASHE|nr:hypothetical protein D915_001210 [Fasciola hepatica]
MFTSTHVNSTVTEIVKVREKEAECHQPESSTILHSPRPSAVVSNVAEGGEDFKDEESQLINQDTGKILDWVPIAEAIWESRVAAQMFEIIDGLPIIQPVYDTSTQEHEHQSIATSELLKDDYDSESDIKSIKTTPGFADRQQITPVESVRRTK